MRRTPRVVPGHRRQAQRLRYRGGAHPPCRLLAGEDAGLSAATGTSKIAITTCAMSPCERMRAAFAAILASSPACAALPSTSCAKTRLPTSVRRSMTTLYVWITSAITLACFRIEQPWSWGLSGHPGRGKLLESEIASRRIKKRYCERRKNHSLLRSARAPDLVVSSGAITAKNPGAIMPKSDNRLAALSGSRTKAPGLCRGILTGAMI